MDYYIITGASKGIGEAIVKQLLKPGNTIFAVSRNLNEDLIEMASAMQVELFYVEQDISDLTGASAFIKLVFEKITLKEGDRIALINNAGMIEPVALLENIDFQTAAQQINLNLLAPMVLISGFIKSTQNIGIPKVVLNISSGAAFIPYAGWGVYCSSKAALDMLTKVAGVEQQKQAMPVKVLALAPGIVATSMQDHLRTVPSDNFPEKEKFIKLHEEGKLSDPSLVAQIITNAIFNESLENGEVTNIDRLAALIDKS
jgi:benzil reductase ((S)-benzoin forming)